MRMILSDSRKLLFSNMIHTIKQKRKTIVAQASSSLGRILFGRTSSNNFGSRKFMNELLCVFCSIVWAFCQWGRQIDDTRRRRSRRPAVLTVITIPHTTFWFAATELQEKQWRPLPQNKPSKNWLVYRAIPFVLTVGRQKSSAFPPSASST